MIEANAKIVKNEASIELILVDDSPDIPLDVDFKEMRYAQGVLLHNEKNCGIHQSRINGIRYSTGDYIIMLDQDDILLDTAVQSQLKHIKNKNVVVGNGYAELPEGKKYLYKYGIMQYTVNWSFFYDYFDCRIISPGHCMIRKESIPRVWLEHSLQNNGADDFFLWLVLLNQGEKFKINRDVVYVHSYTGHNVSADSDKMKRSVEEVIQIAHDTKSISDKQLDRIDARINGSKNLTRMILNYLRSIGENLNDTSKK